MKRRALRTVFVVLFVLTALLTAASTGKAGFFTKSWYPMYAPSSPQMYRSYYVGYRPYYVGYRRSYFGMRYFPRSVYYRSGCSPCATSCSPCATSYSPCGTACASGNCTVNSPPLADTKPLPEVEDTPPKTFADPKVPDPAVPDPKVDEPGFGPRKTEKTPTPASKKSDDDDPFKKPVEKTDPAPKKADTDGSAKVDELSVPDPIRTLPESPVGKRPPAGTTQPKKKAPFDPFSDDEDDATGAKGAKKSAAGREPLRIPSLKLDEKITWRSAPIRTRIEMRASFGNPTVVRTRVDVNQGWVTLPAGSKIVAK